MTMTENELSNCSQNLRYLIDCVVPAFIQSEYVPNQTIPGLKISLSTLKNALYGKTITTRTQQKIASAFSLAMADQRSEGIQAGQLTLDPDEFKALFPGNLFTKKTENGPVLRPERFTNKLFRGYYMIENSSSCVRMAYLKIFESRGKFQAFLVRGIPDFQLVQDVRNNFDTPEHLISCSCDRNSSFYLSKRTEAMKLLIAEDKNIQMTTNSIKIDFHYPDMDICQCSLFWNVQQASQSAGRIYIGGTGILVDTNNGPVKRSMWAHKIGLEAVENTGDAYPENIDPFDSQSELLIRELKPEIKNGMIILDNGDDNRWYHFLLDNSKRNKVSETPENADVGALLRELRQMKQEYAVELDRLRAFLDAQEMNR